MERQRSRRRRGRELFAVALQGDGAQRQRAQTRALDPLVRVALAQTHDAQTGPVALLGVGPALHDRSDESCGRGADLLGPGDQPRRRPLGVRPVRGGHVLGLGRVTELHVGAHVARDAAPRADLDGGCRRAEIEHLAAELVGDAVVVVVELDVVVTNTSVVEALTALVAARETVQDASTERHLRSEGETR